MIVYTCNDFEGVYPVGTAAVVVATDKARAVKHLESALAKIGLPQTIKPSSLVRVDVRKESVSILRDGDY